MAIISFVSAITLGKESVLTAVQLDQHHHGYIRHMILGQPAYHHPCLCPEPESDKHLEGLYPVLQLSEGHTSDYYREGCWVHTRL